MGRPATAESRAKTAESLRAYYAAHPEARKQRSDHMRKVMAEMPPERLRERQRNGGLAATKQRRVTSIIDLSKRTITKVMRRLGVGCSRCGWNEAICDIHHIRGRRIPNPHDHVNLTYLCPNCHRLAHNRKIAIEELVPLSVQIGDSWLEKYYGA